MIPCQKRIRRAPSRNNRSSPVSSRAERCPTFARSLTKYSPGFPILTSLSLRYATYYIAVFFTLGVYLPFWPLWLADRGLAAWQIAVALALPNWVRIVATPVLAATMDRSDRPRALLLLVALLSLFSFVAFIPLDSFAQIMTATVLMSLFMPALVPLGESQVMTAATRHGLDYGRIRLWGSLAFIAATLGAGAALATRPPDTALFLIIAGSAGVALAILVMPPERRVVGPLLERSRVADLLRSRPFLIFLGTASLLQSSHAVYYAFSALHWQASGLSEATIGGLWAWGVTAEVLLFAAGGGLVARFGPRGLLLVAGAAGVLRWALLAATTAWPLLIAAQTLHAATFGAAHLAAMHFISRFAPASSHATAQGLYAAVAGGLMLGLALLSAGPLYKSFGGWAFAAMVGLSAMGFLIALALPRESRHERPTATLTS